MNSNSKIRKHPNPDIDLSFILLLHKIHCEFHSNQKTSFEKS